MKPKTTSPPFVAAQAGTQCWSSDKERPASADSDKRRRQAEAQRMVDEQARQTAASRRALFTAFRLWTVCPSKPCWRHKACRGDASRCMKERWQTLAPPELKALLQKTFANLAGGMTPREAIAAAEASMAAYRRQDEAAPAEKPNPFVPADAGTQALPPPPPRIRRQAPPRIGPRVRQL